MILSEVTTFGQFAGLLSLPSVKRNSCAALGFGQVSYITGAVLQHGSLQAWEHPVLCRPVSIVSSSPGGFNNHSVGGQEAGTAILEPTICFRAKPKSSLRNFRRSQAIYLLS